MKYSEYSTPLSHFDSTQKKIIKVKSKTHANYKKIKTITTATKNFGGEIPDK